MRKLNQEIILENIENELKKSYLNYAMSVIVGRALPDIHDGLKPVHRRVLYSMYKLKNYHYKPYKKSSRIVGDVIGKYHPHGELAVYDAIVRMAQNFSLRYKLINGQGNFGSLDGDSPAAMRYTEIKLSKISHRILDDLDKNTVFFVSNYDNTEVQPSVLPSKIPNLLINGSSGIAVGMATNIPSHNISEVINGIIATINNPLINIEEIMEYIPGPDFPTGGIINGNDGIIDAYNTGKGRIFIRAKYKLEHDIKSNKNKIIINELPYQVNKSKLIENIVNLIKNKKILSLNYVIDESDKEGLRIIFSLKKGEDIKKVINNLYLSTQLEVSYNINMVAIVNGKPKLFNLKEIINEFIFYRKKIILNKIIFYMKKIEKKIIFLEALIIVLNNLEFLINLIKTSKSEKTANEKILKYKWPINDEVKLIIKKFIDYKKFNSGFIDNEFNFCILSEEQVNFILNLKIYKLVSLKQDKIILDLKNALNDITNYRNTIFDENKLIKIVKNELLEIEKEFGDKRRTVIINKCKKVFFTDLISNNKVVITLTNLGYIKSQLLNLYQIQKRGGKGKSGAKIKDKDFIFKVFVINNYDTLFYFSNLGKVYKSPGYKIPVAGRESRGKPIINIIPLKNYEEIKFISSISNIHEFKAIILVTKNGFIKKIHIDKLKNLKNHGMLAINLQDKDIIVGVDFIKEEEVNIMLFTNIGKSIMFSSLDLRYTERSSRGVIGIKLGKNAKVVSLIIVNKDVSILFSTLNGYGKRTNVNEFNKVKRGSKGITCIKINKKNGQLVTADKVDKNDELMLITNKGVLIRTRIKEIPQISRNTQGVKLINLSSGEFLVGVSKFSKN